MKHQDALISILVHSAGGNSKLSSDLVDVLSISKDAVYRRLRLETAFSWDEVIKMANHYKLSLDGFLNEKLNSVSFERSPFIDKPLAFMEYLKRSLTELEILSGREDAHLVYSAKDIPIFYQFGYEKMARFKMRTWMHSLYSFNLHDRSFESAVNDEMLQLAKKLHQVYVRIPCTEIWNETSIQSLINQMWYYFEAGLLRQAESFEIINECRNMLMRINAEAEMGSRSTPQDINTPSHIKFEMYYQDILLMDNHILLRLESQSRLFLSWGGLNFIRTEDPKMVSDMERYLEGQYKRSTLISRVSEKERNRWKRLAFEKLDKLERKIQSE